MRVQITARHVEVPEDVRSRAEELIQKLERFDPELLSADLVFEEVRHLRKVEAVLSIANADRMVATGESDEWLTALDELSERLGRMLRKRRDRLRNHHGA